MKIAISTDGDYVSAHFGRCPSFTIVEIENGELIKQELIENPGHHPGFLPQFLQERGVSHIIAGGMGPRAAGLFVEAGIETIMGITGDVEEVIDQVLKGTLKGGESLCQPGSGKGYGIEKTECDHPHQPSEEPVQQENQGTDNKETKGIKVCVTSQGDNLAAQVDPRFGRCQYFIIVDTETMEFEALENPGIAAASGAGIQSAQLIANKGVRVVLTGNVGPNAYQTLQAAGLQIITGVSGSVQEVIQGYKRGEFAPVRGPTVPGHFGVQSPSPMRPGMGRGRGIGWPQPLHQMPPRPQISREQELEMLKEQAQALKEQIETINKRIDELTKKEK